MSNVNVLDAIITDLQSGVKIYVDVVKNNTDLAIRPIDFSILGCGAPS